MTPPTRQQRALAAIKIVRGWVERDRAEVGPEYDVGAALAQLIAQVLPNARVALYLAALEGQSKPTMYASDDVDLDDLLHQILAVEENRKARVVGGDLQ